MDNKNVAKAIVELVREKRGQDAVVIRLPSHWCSECGHRCEEDEKEYKPLCRHCEENDG